MVILSQAASQMSSRQPKRLTWRSTDRRLCESPSTDQLERLLRQVPTQQLLLGPALDQAHCTAEAWVYISHGCYEGMVGRSGHEGLVGGCHRLLWGVVGG